MQYGGNAQQQYPRRELQFQPQSFQEGGHISPAYASLFRKKKKQFALDAFGEEQTEQVGKQKKAGLFGSIASLAGGAGAAWLTPLLFSNPATAALALPWLVGGASGAGKWLGEKKGYGEEQDIDMDIMYAKEAGLEDIERAGEEYQSDMFGRAAVSGLKAGLTAGFAPDGGMYGKIAGRGAPGTAAGTAATQSSFGLQEAPTSLTGGAPALQLPQARTAIAGTETGLLGGGIPESLGNIPSAPSAVSDAGTGALSSGVDISGEFQAAKLANEASLKAQSVQEQMSKLLSSPTINKYLGKSSDLPSSSGVMSGGTGGFGQAFANAREAGEEMFEWNGKMYNTVLAQSGGMIRQNPQSLLGYLG